LKNSPHRSVSRVPAGFAGWSATLPGDWRLERRYTDGSRFEGNALFTAEHGAIALAETGALRVCSGPELPAARNWTWRLHGAETLHIHFRDPARAYLYHGMSVAARGNGWTGVAGHDCGADHYRGRYIFEKDRIIVRQWVAGPQKNYAFVTYYQRMPCN
jgi:Family of unknown function (DUF6314)